MKPIILMIILTFTTFTKSSEIKQNSISIENLEEADVTKHTSKIQQRSILRFFGLKPRYKPIQISLNWRMSNQQRSTQNNNNRFNNELFNSRPISFQIQKNFFFSNGLNAGNIQNNPATLLSTTPKYLTTTENVLENKSTTRIENTFSKSSMEQTEDTNPKTTQINQIATSTTLKPPTEKSSYVIPSTEPTVTNNLNAQSIKGGFTSTSMPEDNQYSELIYDIDPRYRKR